MQEVAGSQIRASVRTENDEWRTRQRRREDMSKISNGRESKRGGRKIKTTIQGKARPS